MAGWAQVGRASDAAQREGKWGEKRKKKSSVSHGGRQRDESTI